MTTQVNREVVDPVNPNMDLGTSRVRNFVRINPPKFYGSKPKEDAQRFTYEVYIVPAILGVSSEEKADLSTYKLKGVPQVWYDKWKGERPVGGGLVEYEFLKLTFLTGSFP